MSLLFLILIAAIIWYVIVPVVKTLYRAHRQAKQWRDLYRQATGQGSSNPFGGFGGHKRSEQSEPQPKRKKVFTKDVGEYVDFEEITDTQTATSSPEGSSYEHTTTHARYTGPADPRVTDADWEDIP
ncbi:MAG: DUF4834 family protein [Candidatus Amulumruptor caecigallinarius]|nr:DUF4834 family protein [Candidatus Amulumruptor caecigallinarius]MCM1396469.1 DUF4834 family protein [Candidatus Amulumruptor caecigallinarius]MCM1453474.1 DUF4834 family protein [bacterium]